MTRGGSRGGSAPPPGVLGSPEPHEAPGSGLMALLGRRGQPACSALRGPGCVSLFRTCPASAGRCGRRASARAPASAPCTSSSRRCAAAAGPCHRFPAGGRGHFRGCSGCPGSQEEATHGSASHGVLRACCDAQAALLSAPSVSNHPFSITSAEPTALSSSHVCTNCRSLLPEAVSQLPNL